ncbi:hypothetical protein ACFLZZ_00215 [Nanoarchaeota archaeon]
MPREYDFDHLKNIGKPLEVHYERGESIKEFRMRVADAHLSLHGDSIAAAEIAAGKSDKKFSKGEQMLSLALCVAHNRDKAAKLNAKGDTYRDISWKGFHKVAEEKNFEKCFSYNFTYYPEYGGEKVEEFVVWAQKEKGMLLTGESYFVSPSERRVNSAMLNYELLMPAPWDKLDKIQELILINMMGRGSSCPTGSGLEDNGKPIFDDDFTTYCKDFDSREGLVEHLDMLGRAEVCGFKTDSPWKFYDEHFLWLCDSGESQVKRRNYREIAKKKISQFPKDVRAMLGLK